MSEPGKLFVVATPIGNLEDMTLRAIRTLQEVALIAAEDTRRTRILLDHYRIRTPMTSLNEHNESEKSAALLAKIKEGLSIACVTDAGTPAFSDPGYVLIRHAIHEGIGVVAIPGVCALITALCVSGLPMDHFVFQGFLPVKRGKRRIILESLLTESRTQVFYESPKRLVATLSEIGDILGNREVVVARELTKIHEEVIRGDVKEVVGILEGRVVKGEITLLVAGKKQEETMIDPEAAIKAQLECLSVGGVTSRRDMVDRIAEALSLPRKVVYRAVNRLCGG